MAKKNKTFGQEAEGIFDRKNELAALILRVKDT